jgi:hypothetical protein
MRIVPAPVLLVLFAAMPLHAQPGGASEPNGSGPCADKVGNALIDCVATSDDPARLARVIDLMKLDALYAASTAATLAASDARPLFALARGRDQALAAKAVTAMTELVFYLRARSSKALARIEQRVALACAQAASAQHRSLARAGLRCVAEWPSPRGLVALERRVLADDETSGLALQLAAKATREPSARLTEAVWEMLRRLPVEHEWVGSQVAKVADACRALTQWNLPATPEQTAMARHAWEKLRAVRPQEADACLLLALASTTEPRWAREARERVTGALVDAGGVDTSPDGKPDATPAGARESAGCHGDFAATLLARTPAPDKLASFGASPSAGPGLIPHAVKKGETVPGVAFARGLSWGLRDYARPENRDFRATNPDFRRLKRGSVLWMEEPNQELRMRFLEVSYRSMGVTIEGTKVDGDLSSDRDGNVPLVTPEGVVDVVFAFQGQCQKLVVGALQGSGTIVGIQQRLANLGYTVSSSGRLDSATRSGIGRFQTEHALPRTGELDERTHAAIVAAYHSSDD